MTPQKAIECIDEVLCATVHYDETLEYELTTDDIEWLEMAKKTLEKLTPQKVKHCEKKNDDYLVQSYLVEGRVVKWFECPKCEKRLRKYYSFCPHCSKALDWSDTK